MSTSNALPKLGIIAGGGRMPALLIQACASEGRPFFVLAVEGHAEVEVVEKVPHRFIRLGMVGDALKLLKHEKIEQVVMAGHVGRPSLSSLRPDFVTTKLIARLGSNIFNGDDALLTSIVQFLEGEGFPVIGADDVLKSLLAPLGTLGKHAPTQAQEADIVIGVKAARALGALDIGQAIVVEKGYVLAVEAAEGTEGLLARVGALKQYPAPDGILIKVKKPAQERRIDLPTIGPKTIEDAHKAGLAGIAVEAGCSIILDQSKVAEIADALGLFVVGVDHA